MAATDQATRGGGRPKCLAKRRRQQRSPDDAEEREARDQVEGEVDGVIPADVLEEQTIGRAGAGWGQSVPDAGGRERVVQREGEARDRPAGERRITRRRHGGRQWPQAADVDVLRDGGLVVENEDAGEAVRVGGNAERNEDGRGDGNREGPRGRSPSSRQVDLRGVSDDVRAPAGSRAIPCSP